MRWKSCVAISMLVSVFCSCGILKDKKQDVVTDSKSKSLKEEQEVSYKTFSAQYSGKYNSIPFKLQVRASHDSIIWVSLTALFQEVGRMQVTEDSVYVLDKINSNAYIISKHTIEQSSGYKLDNAELERIVTDTVNMEKSFDIGFLGVAKMNLKKQQPSYDTQNIEIEVKRGGKTYKVSLNRTSIKYDEVQQYPFAIPNKFSIERR